jgi:2-succinyl-6-hydroxy-2,4-cyclohexadiene-1-carboxylate synthase
MAGTAARLADRHRVVSIDLIGHGRSASPADGDAYTMERCVEQIAATLDGLAVPSAHVVGYSMGGRTALALATWRPGRVRSLVLVGASAGLEDEAERAARRSHDEALADSIERDGIEAFVDRWMALPLFASQARLGAEWLARARRQRLANDPVGLALSLRGMGTGAQPPLHACLGSLEAPVCWVAGDEDAKFTKLAEALAPRCRDGRVCIVPGSGHACHLEQPEAFAEIARKHIETAEQGRNPS